MNDLREAISKPRFSLLTLLIAWTSARTIYATDWHWSYKVLAGIAATVCIGVDLWLSVTRIDAREPQE